MTTTASKNLQNKYYICKKSDLSNMEEKGCCSRSRTEGFYCVQ